MNQLIKTNQKVLTETEFEGLKVREEAVENLQKALFDQIAIGYKITKSKAEAGLTEAIQTTIEILVPEIKERFGMLTIPEICYALRNGFYGHYGEFFGITPLTLVQFLSKYMESDKRRNMIQVSKKAQLKLEKPKTLTLEEKRSFWEQCEKDFKVTGVIQGAPFLYKIGNELGKIDESDEMFIEEVKFKAKKRLEADKELIKEKKGLAGKTDVRQIEEVLKALEEESEKKTTNAKWKTMCKRVAVEMVMGGE